MHCSHAPSSRINVEALFTSQWEDVAFIQFLCVDQDKSMEIRRNFPDVPNLGGAYDPRTDQLQEFRANSGRDRGSEEEDEDAAGGTKRPRSEAGSDNPRPRGVARTTTEEHRQASADGNLDDIDWDALSEEGSVAEAGYHMLEADE